MWLIKRTTPIGLHYGYAIPVFIRNLDYHLATVDVFSDGAINAWEFLDRDLFDEKLRSGWVWPQPPVDGTISVFNLGECNCSKVFWKLTAEDIRAAVHSAILKLNPSMVGLLDMQGSSIELRGGVRYTKLGQADDRPCRQSEAGEDIDGREVPVFDQSGDEIELTRAFVFADGSARVGSDRPFITHQALFDLFESGVLSTRVPDGSVVNVGALGAFEAVNGSWLIEPAERVRELRGLIQELRGSPSLQQACIKVFKEYEREPTKQNKERLRLAYEAVPEHLRIFCGDMDSKDQPIRRILYNEKPLYEIGLQVSGGAMLAALAAGLWAFIIGPSSLVTGAFLLIAVVGLVGIAVTCVGFYAGRPK